MPIIWMHEAEQYSNDDIGELGDGIAGGYLGWENDMSMAHGIDQPR